MLTLVILFLLLVPTLVRSQAWDDPTPHVLLYADFENVGDLTPIGSLTQATVVRTTGKFGQGLEVAKNGAAFSSRMTGPGLQLDPIRGSLTLWLQLTTTTHTGATEVFSTNPGPPRLQLYYQSAVLPHTLLLSVDGQFMTATVPVTFVAGMWYHLAWTWWGAEHKVYVDGVICSVVVRESVSSTTGSPASPSPTLGSPMVSSQGATTQVGTFSGGVQNAVIDELTIYNVTLTANEITTLKNAVAGGYLTAFDAHGLLLDVQWAPGDTRAHVAVDVGNVHVAAAVTVDVLVKNAAGTTVGSGTIPSLRRGFGEVVLPVSPMGPDTYHAEVTVKNAGGATLTTGSSTPFVVPSTPWLGNTLGLTDVLQPPWTPITRAGATFGVIGRSVELTGGFGLPQQMTSQGLSLLSTPVTLEVVQGGTPIPATPVASGAMQGVTIGGGGPGLTAGMASGAVVRADVASPAQGVSITGTSNHAATWVGAGVAGAVQVQVQGSLDYDGMLLFTTTLTPTAGPVAVDGINLQLTLPAARAQWMHTTTDQRFWWYPYKAATASSEGVFHTNLLQEDNKTKFLPVVVFSDHEVGLEWFAESPAGWRIDETQVIQQMVRDAGDVIRLENKIANHAFTLDQPLTFTFGLMATPTKPLPSDWRSWSVHFNALAITSSAHLWWAWPSDLGGTCRGGDFNLHPTDPACWNAAWASRRTATPPVKIIPFTNAHVEVPHAPDTWASLLAILFDETQNDQWIGQPTRGFNDYWIYQLNQWFATAGLDGVYIDESFGFGVTQYLLAGGYVKPNGTHGFGFNTLGVRQLLKRVRQLPIAHGLVPLVWIHNTSTMTPHMFSFVDIVSDGEAFMYETPADPDWVDTWGNQLLTPTVGPGLTGGPWLLSIGRAQKYGFLPIFLNYIQFSGDTTNYPPAMRAYHGLTGLLDIVPINYLVQGTTAYMTAKDAFGIGAADVTWLGYWTQTAVVPSRADVQASYHKRATSALVHVMNLGEAFSGLVAVNLATLGLPGGTVKDAETNAPYTVTGGQITMTIPRHDFRLLRIDAP